MEDLNLLLDKVKFTVYSMLLVSGDNCNFGHMKEQLAGC